MGKVISVINQKGGVGKTTIAFNLAKGLAKKGNTILAIDNDPQGNLTSAFIGSHQKPAADILNFYKNQAEIVIPQTIDNNLYLIGADIHLSKVSDSGIDVIFNLKEGLDRMKNRYDYVIIDCLPSFGYLNMAALKASDYVLVPTKPAPFSLEGLRDLFDSVEKAKKRFNPDLKIIGIVLNLVEGRKTIIGEEIEQVLRDKFGDLVFTTKISRATAIEESPSEQKSIVEYSPESKHADLFNQLVDELLERM
ncbi:MAG: ParA family protein [Candidatus Cloacimonetes bacterium]|nr:ParA family protein [Candidatus Cloacimonadota bacterium]